MPGSFREEMNKHLFFVSLPPTSSKGEEQSIFKEAYERLSLEMGTKRSVGKEGLSGQGTMKTLETVGILRPESSSVKLTWTCGFWYCCANSWLGSLMSGSSENTMVNLKVRPLHFHTQWTDIGCPQNTVLMFIHSLPNLFQFSIFAAV